MAATWSLLRQNSYEWPQELRAGNYKKAEKAGKIKKVLDELEKGEKFMKALDPPYQWVTTNPVTHLNWQKLALKFMEGTSKKLAGHLDSISDEAKKAAKDKAAAADRDSKEALDKIVKSAEVHLKMIQPGVIRKEVDELNKLFGEAREEFLEKKTGEAVKDAKALAAKRHPGIVAAGKKLAAAAKADDGKDDREEARDQLSEAAHEIVDCAVVLLKAKQQKLEIKGLGSSEWSALAKVTAGLKPFAGSADWTGKLDQKTMMAGHDMIAKMASVYDAVCKRMEG